MDRRHVNRGFARAAAVGLAAVGVVALAGPAAAQGDEVHNGALTTSVFAKGRTLSGGITISKADDITVMDGRIFVSWQNGVGPMGEPAGTVTDSTVVEYSRSGRLLRSWQLAGRCDGLGADAAHDRLIATVNEDGNSSLYVIRPRAAAGSQLAHYSYSPNPPVHGGGTDAVHIYRGQIFISASNPSNSAQPAVYRATLSGTTATLTPVFFDNSTATVANTNDPASGSKVTLALGDPDSNTVVPRSSPRFGGDFMLDSQGDGEQIYVSHAGTSGQLLSVLTLHSHSDPSTSVDDTVWATAADGVLYATDGGNTVYAIRGRFDVGAVYSAVTPGNANTPSSEPNWLATLNLETGFLTPVANVGISPKGLVFVAGRGENEGENSDQ